MTTWIDGKLYRIVYSTSASLSTSPCWAVRRDLRTGRRAAGMKESFDDSVPDPWADGNGCLPGAIVSGYVLRKNPDIDYEWDGTAWLPQRRVVSDDLVERLEHLAMKMEALGTYDDWHRVVCEAANRIEALEAAMSPVVTTAANRMATTDQHQHEADDGQDDADGHENRHADDEAHHQQD